MEIYFAMVMEEWEVILQWCVKEEWEVIYKGDGRVVIYFAKVMEEWEVILPW